MDADKKFDINKPPQGAWIQHGSGVLIIGATTRAAIAFLFVPFTILWITLGFWLTIGVKMYSLESNWALFLFGVFLLITSVLLIGDAFMVVCGKVEITLNERSFKIFRGVGILGSTQVYPLNSVSVNVSVLSTHVFRLLKTEKPNNFKFRLGLKEERYDYLVRVVEVILNDKKFLKKDLTDHLLEN